MIVETVFMSSCTVYYESLLGSARWNGIKYGPDFADSQRVWDLFERWLEENITSTYRQHTEGVWFLDEAAAVMFKLAWTGQDI